MESIFENINTIRGINLGNKIKLKLYKYFVAIINYFN